MVRMWLRFQLTAARRRLDEAIKLYTDDFKFQLTAARRRLAANIAIKSNQQMFQLTAARRRLDTQPYAPDKRTFVSTHSRPKAAGG